MRFKNLDPVVFFFLGLVMSAVIFIFVYMIVVSIFLDIFDMSYEYHSNISIIVSMCIGYTLAFKQLINEKKTRIRYLNTVKKIWKNRSRK